MISVQGLCRARVPIPERNAEVTPLTLDSGKFNTVSTTLESIRSLAGTPVHYAVRMAQTAEEIRAAQTLRFEASISNLTKGLNSHTSPDWMKTCSMPFAIISSLNIYLRPLSLAHTASKPATTRRRIWAITAPRSSSLTISSRFAQRRSS
jgi:hypothetical protein